MFLKKDRRTQSYWDGLYTEDEEFVRIVLTERKCVRDDGGESLENWGFCPISSLQGLLYVFSRFLFNTRILRLMKTQRLETYNHSKIVIMALSGYCNHINIPLYSLITGRNDQETLGMSR